jgi:lipopolysaccharide transport system ATP-binding protein
MTEIAVRAESLAKQYWIGGRQPAHRLSDLFTGGWWRKSRKRFCALDDVSFEIAHGEIVGIIGRNGAGKSTLLKILSRVVRPSSGSAELHGRFASLLEVGTGFHPELTGRENIFISGAMLGMTRVEIAQQFDEIVAFAGVDEFLDTPIKRYSSGMQTRLGFAIAAHLPAEILLIDEVLAVGDAEFQKKCLGKMKEVAVDGRTVLFVSHNMNSVQALCDRAIWLDKGRIRADSSDVRRVTLDYLSGDMDRGRAEWINETKEEKDSPIILHAMRLVAPDGNVVSAPMRNDSELTVIIEFDLRISNSALNVGYAIYTDDGETLWWSLSTDEAAARWPILRKGRNHLQSSLPRRWLNEGRYRLQFISSIHSIEWVHGPGQGGPSIGFEIQGGLSDSPLWTARRTGILAPALSWKSLHDDSKEVELEATAK